MNIITKTMSDLVSIIIPAYNAASRVRLTLESIISQDYGDLEIIVVNDSSQDDTEKIARKVLESSGRSYRLINHEHNRGECASRNTGIKHAEGRYICFVDADDMICTDFVSSLHDAIVQNECDISFCGLIDRFTDGRPDADIAFAHGRSYVREGVEFILAGEVPSVYCCMYSAEFLRKNGLVFHEGCIAGGDVEFTKKALCTAHRVTFTAQCLYVYVHHADMGSVKDNDTPAKKMLRYEANTGAVFRTAEYLSEHAHTDYLKRIAVNVLLPQSIIRRFTLAAKKHDRDGYYSLLQDKETMKILRKGLSFYTFRHNAEVFMKVLCILLLPGIYYRMRAR